MKYLSLLLFALSLSAEIHDNPQVDATYPWEYVTINMRAVYTNQAGQFVAPAPGKWYNMIIQDNESSGYHSHGSDASPRPSQTPVASSALLAGETPIRRMTDLNGYVQFRWKGNNFAGEVTTALVPEDSTFPIEKYHVYLGYFDQIRAGSSVQPVYLRALPAYGDLADFTRHDDTRHLDNAGQVGNSRYASINAIANIELMAHYFRTRAVGGYKLDVPRISLRDGGCADNKMLAGAGTVYQYAVWQKKACNSYGIAIDIENPAIAAGGVGTQNGGLAYGTFDQVAENLLRCKFNKLMDDGVTLVPTATSPVPFSEGGYLQVNDYWLHQPIVSLICSLPPGGKGN